MGAALNALNLDPKTALVIIDLQNAIVGMNTAPIPPLRSLKTQKLAEAFRANGAPVVYVRVDLNDLLRFPVDEPHNMGDKPIPPVASEIAASAGFQCRRHPHHEAPLGLLCRQRP